MREPRKSGDKEMSEARKNKDGGGLGNIDDLTGHPGKGTPGNTMKESENPDPSKGVQPKSPKDGTG